MDSFQLVQKAPERASPSSNRVRADKTNGAKINYDHPKEQQLPPQRELLLLFALQSAGSKGGYGLAIKSKIEDASGGRESFSIGSLYSLLKRLKRKGYVDSREGDTRGGGAQRQYYFLTKSGREVLCYVDEFFHRLQNGGLRD